MKVTDQVAELLDELRQRLLKIADKQHRPNAVIDRVLVQVIEMKTTLLRQK